VVDSFFADQSGSAKAFPPPVPSARRRSTAPSRRSASAATRSATRKAKRLRLIATEACRAAANADSFRDRVAAETGIRLEVIDRETEATLAVIGCSPLLDAKGRGAILFDIGGGSTELVRIERDPAEQNASPRIKAWMSIRSASSLWPSFRRT